MQFCPHHAQKPLARLTFAIACHLLVHTPMMTLTFYIVFLKISPGTSMIWLFPQLWRYSHLQLHLFEIWLEQTYFIFLHFAVATYLSPVQQLSEACVFPFHLSASLLVCGFKNNDLSYSLLYENGDCLMTRLTGSCRHSVVVYRSKKKFSVSHFSLNCLPSKSAFISCVLLLASLQVHWRHACLFGLLSLCRPQLG